MLDRQKIAFHYAIERSSPKELNTILASIPVPVSEITSVQTFGEFSAEVKHPERMSTAFKASVRGETFAKALSNLKMHWKDASGILVTNCPEMNKAAGKLDIAVLYVGKPVPDRELTQGRLCTVPLVSDVSFVMRAMAREM